MESLNFPTGWENFSIQLGSLKLPDWVGKNCPGSKSSVLFAMSNKGVLCLIICSIMCTASLDLSSYLLTTKCSLDSTINGDDNLVKNEMKYDILSLDPSVTLFRVMKRGVISKFAKDKLKRENCTYKA